MKALGSAFVIKTEKNQMPMRARDVLATWTDTKLLADLTGFNPNTNIEHGIKQFVV
jgi:UDP-glucuronate 4-epimerase